MLAAQNKHYKGTFCTRGVFLSFRISATTPLISIPALSMNGYPQTLPNTGKPKITPTAENRYNGRNTLTQNHIQLIAGVQKVVVEKCVK